MRTLPMTRRRALALIAAPLAAWTLRAWPAAAQQEPEVPLPPPVEDQPTAKDAPSEGVSGVERPVQLETKITTETPVGAKPAATTEKEQPKTPEPYVRKKAERQTQERVKQERKASTRKKRERKASDRGMRRNY